VANENDYYEEDEAEQADPRVDTNTELILALTKPGVAAKFAKFVSRDISIGFLPKNQPELVELGRKYVSLIGDFVFLGLDDMAQSYNADFKTFLGLNRSVGGFERKQQTTTTVNKNIDDTRKKSRWGLG
jgi:hypothetical protein